MLRLVLWTTAASEAVRRFRQKLAYLATRVTRSTWAHVHYADMGMHRHSEDDLMGTISWLGGQNVEHFDGTNSWRRILGRQCFPASGPFTVSVTFCATPQHTGNAEVISVDGGTPFYLGRLWNGNIRAGDAWSDTGVPFPSDGNWHRLTLVRQDNATILYLDGDEKARLGYGIPNPSGLDFRIGRQYGDHGEFFRGAVAEVVVFNEAHSAAQVQSYEAGGLTGAKPGVLTLVRFDLDQRAELVSGQQCSGSGNLRNAPTEPPLASSGPSLSSALPVRTQAFQLGKLNITIPTIPPLNLDKVKAVAGGASLIIAGSALLLQTISAALAALNVNRKVSIGLNNHLKQDLIEPKYFCLMGKITEIPLVIPAGEADRIIAGQSESEATGAVGLVAYRIKDTRLRLVIMFSVPFDQVSYENWFKLSIVSDEVGIDEKLYDDMYYNRGRLTPGNVTAGKEGHAQWVIAAEDAKQPYLLDGIMGNGGNTVLDVAVWKLEQPQNIVTRAPVPLVVGQVVIASIGLVFALIAEIFRWLQTDRKIGMAIDNQSGHDLHRPKYYTASGKITAIGLCIRQKNAGLISAEKSASTPYGTYGVVSYAIGQTGKRLVIMWSIPGSYAAWKNWFKATVTDEHVPMNDKLFDDMYNDKVPEYGKCAAADGGTVKWQSGGYILEGIMTNGGSASMRLSITDPNLPPPPAEVIVE
jgi:hypothetical protein